LPTIEDKLKQMGLNLPPPPTPVANYLPAVQINNIVFLSGHIPRRADGSLVTGTLGQDYTVEDGYEIARQITLSLFASLKDCIGDLDMLKRIVRVSCMVNSTSEFTQHPLVANGASDLLVALLGEHGKHTRVAAGMSSLPGGVPVEIEMMVELES
jgi:enamine deaminase RidA (YjgF/YER057c/UK114 family)